MFLHHRHQLRDLALGDSFRRNRDHHPQSRFAQLLHNRKRARIKRADELGGMGATTGKAKMRAFDVQPKNAAQAMGF